MTATPTPTPPQASPQVPDQVGSHAAQAGGPPPGAPASVADGHPPTSDGSRSVALLAAAAALVVTVIALVLLFGVARPPALTALVDDPLPGLAAGVAWTAWGQDGPCVTVAAPDGTVREVTCSPRGEELISYDEQGVGLVVWEQREQLEVLDVDTGERVDLRSLTGTDWGWDMTDDVHARRVDGRLVLRDRVTDTVLWEVEAPEGYQIRSGRRSPDGAWVAAFDSAGRLLVLPADGSAPPRVWHEDADVWQTPVWEGTPAPDGTD